MAEALKRRNGTIKYTNLTRNLGEGDVPDTEFIYAILANVPSLENNQVYIQRDNIIDGDPSKFVDGVEVNFMPIKVSEEKFQAALDAGKPIRKYAGMDVVLASTNSDSAEENVVEDQVAEIDSDSAVVTATKNVEVKSQKNEKVSAKPIRIKIFPDGDDSIRSTGNNFHQKDIQTFGEDGKLAPLTIRLSSTHKFTLVDLMSNRILVSGANKANNVSSFQWQTPPEGIQTIGIKFVGTREISLSLVELTNGETISFRLRKV